MTGTESLSQVYQKYIHLDELLSSEGGLMTDNFFAQITRDLWLAIKEVVSASAAPTDCGRHEP